MTVARDNTELNEKLVALFAEGRGGALHLVGGHLPLTDMGNSERLVRDYGEDLRHVPAWGWLRWDGRHWVSGDRWVQERAKDGVRSIYREAAEEEDKDIRKMLAGHARYSERKGAVSAMVSLTTTVKGIAVDVSDFDADPWSLTVGNGTLDLRTGELRPHRREDHVTRLVEVEYDPSARHPLWEGFLDYVCEGKEGLREFLARAAGYTLTGSTEEEVLFTLHGPAGCGKTTFVEALASVLGSYAGGVRIEALTDSGRMSGGHNEDIARLVGLRLVSAVEASEGDRLREGLVKSLTGGDTVPASRKNKPAFEFRPAFKLWLATNHVPRVRADDSGMQRRLLKLPFEHRLTPGCLAAAPSGNLKRELRSPEVRQAILAWAVEGCLQWQREGLKPPDSVKAATDDLWRQMDALGQFFDECLIFGDTFKATARQIRGAYDAWCEEEAIQERYRASQKRMAEALRGRGADNRRTGAARLWVGVGVRSDACDASSATGAQGRATADTWGEGSHGSQASPGPRGSRAPSANSATAETASSDGDGSDAHDSSPKLPTLARGGLAVEQNASQASPRDVGTPPSPPSACPSCGGQVRLAQGRTDDGYCDACRRYVRPIYRRDGARP